MKKTLITSLLILIGVLLLDQVLKIWIKTTFEYREDVPVIGDWFRLHFIENNGFAFGTEVGGKYGKLFLTLFRLVAVGFITYYLWTLINAKDKIRKGYIFMITLILAGALGNIIDSVFYGVIFSESPYHGGLATMFPEGGGYAPLFYGKVVDMLYFPLFEGYLPEWIPFIGGDYFEFFKPVFNVADSAITAGIFGILLFYRQELHNSSTSNSSKSQLQSE